MQKVRSEGGAARMRRAVRRASQATPPPHAPRHPCRAGEEDGFRLPLEESAGHTVKRGQRVIQLAFGSGFKTNSSVLLRL